MSAALEQLVEVRSQLAEALLDYFRTVESALARNPLLVRFGRSLDEVRIPLRVVPFEPVRHREEAAQTEHLRPPLATRDDEEPDRKRYAHRSGPRDEREPVQQPPKPLSDVEPLLQHAVLLADPGGGKTEWLKDLARRQAIRSKEELENRTVAPAEVVIPVFLRLPEVAKALGRGEEDERDGALRDFLAHTGCLAPPAILGDAQRVAAAMLMRLVEQRQLPERLAPFVWEQWFPAPPAAHAASLTRRPLVCLDAWDEVRKGRERLAHCLNAFAAESACRIFLTSRIVGYSHRPLPVESVAEGTRRELRICPFEWDDTEKFVSDWFCADPERGGQMIGELRAKISVWGMAGNPLMATLLCMAYSPSARRDPLPFPLRRGAVYERVLWGLLGEWPRQRGEEEQELRALGEEEKKRCAAKLDLLAELAHHFFLQATEHFSRTALEEAMRGYLSSQRGKQFHTQEAMRWLSGLTKEQKDYFALLDDDEKRDWVRDNVVAVLCQELIERDGLLALDIEDEDESYYGFLHLTFQEYLTACVLADRANHNGWQTIEAFMDKKAWHPAWQELIVMLAGKLSNPVPLLEMLSNLDPTPTNSHGDDLFRHRLALAAVCLPELNSAIRNSQSSIIDQITTAAFHLWWRHKMKRPLGIILALAPALPALGKVNGRVKGMPFLERIGQYLSSRRARVRIAAARGVSDIGSAAATPAILDRLFHLLQDGNLEVREAAAWAIGSIGAAAATPSILGQLVRLLRHPDLEVKELAPSALGLIGSAAATDTVLDQLAQLLQDSDRDVWLVTAKAVKGIGGATATPAFLDRLLHLLQDRNSDVREAAALAVGNIGSAAATPVILDQLARLLQDSDRYVRAMAAQAVGNIGRMAGTPDILDQLTLMLQKSDLFVWFAAVKAITSIGSGVVAPDIIDRQVQPLEDPDWLVRHGAVQAVCRIGNAAAAPSIINRLTRLMRGSNSWGKIGAVKAVGCIGPAAATDAVLDQLAQLLQDPDARFEAMKAIRNIGSAAAAPAFLDHLLNLLQDRNSEVRVSAAHAIGNIGSAAATPAIVDRLARLTQDRRSEVRSNAVAAISNIGSAAVTPAFLDCLLNLLQDRNSEVRVSAAHAIGNIGSAAATPIILDRLVRLMEDSDWVMQRLAMRALRLIDGTPPDRFGQYLRRSDELHHSLAQLVPELALRKIMRQGVRIFRQGWWKWGKVYGKRVEELAN